MYPQFFSLIFCGTCLGISFWRFRNVFHPHFVFTLMWVYLLPLGPILQPEPAEDLVRIHGAKLELLQYLNMLIHGYLIVLFLVTMAYSRRSPSLNSARMKKSIVQFRKIAPRVGLFGGIILLAQFFRQLGASDWSVAAWFDFTFGARFGRPWSGQAVGGVEFMFTLLNALFPISGIALAFAANFSRGAYGFVFLGGLIFLLCMQVGDGSRTPMTLTIMTFAGCWWISRSGASRYIVAALAVALLILLISLMSRFRMEGLSTMTGTSDLSSIEYHQDDNYFRLLNTMLVADSGQADKWDAKTFLAASILNPIPRFIWPSKPLLDSDFYGEWKVFYVTTTYIGEWIAMFGITLGFIFSLCYATGGFTVLQIAYKRFRKSGGFFLYIGLAFYMYMGFRSIFNLGIYAAFMAGVLVIYHYLSKKGAVGSKRVTKQGTPRSIRNVS